jgi:hypothetical protein
MPWTEIAPGPGKSTDASTVGLNDGGMQKMLAAVVGWSEPSRRSPPGEPVSVIVWAPPPAGPKAPGFRCSQSWNPVFVHWAVEMHGVATCGSQLPVPAAVQQGKGAPAPVHPALWGQNGLGSPSKQPVPDALMSRQKPQNTCLCASPPTSAMAVHVTDPVVSVPVFTIVPTSALGGGGQSALVGKSDRVLRLAESAGVQGMPSFGPPWHTFEPPQVPPPGQSVLVLHGPPLFVPPEQVMLHTGQA